MSHLNSDRFLDAAQGDRAVEVFPVFSLASHRNEKHHKFENNAATSILRLMEAVQKLIAIFSGSEIGTKTSSGAGTEVASGIGEILITSAIELSVATFTRKVLRILIMH